MRITTACKPSPCASAASADLGKPPQCRVRHTASRTRYRRPYRSGSSAHVPGLAWARGRRSGDPAPGGQRRGPPGQPRLVGRRRRRLPGRARRVPRRRGLRLVPRGPARGRRPAARRRRRPAGAGARLRRRRRAPAGSPPRAPTRSRSDLSAGMLRHAATAAEPHRGTRAAGAGRRAGPAVRRRRVRHRLHRVRRGPVRRRLGGASMREVFRVLRPGGRWVFSVTHPMRWIFLDDPGEGGLIAVHSYFDRAPLRRAGRARRGRPTSSSTAPSATGSASWSAPGSCCVDLVEPEWPEGHERDLGPVEPAARPALPRHRDLRRARTARRLAAGRAPAALDAPQPGRTDRSMPRASTPGYRASAWPSRANSAAVTTSPGPATAAGRHGVVKEKHAPKRTRRTPGTPVNASPDDAAVPDPQRRLGAETSRHRPEVLRHEQG